MNHLKTIDLGALTNVTGGFGFSDLMQGSWSSQAEKSNNASKDPSASTSEGAGKPGGTFSGGLRNLMSGFGIGAR